MKCPGQVESAIGTAQTGGPGRQGLGVESRGNEERLLMNEFLFGVLKMSGTRQSWLLPDIVNVLTAGEFFTLKRHFLKSLT